MLRAGARIIRADLTSRPLPTLLTGIVIAVAAGALLVTLHLRNALDDPFNALFRATNAPHVIVAGPAAQASRIAHTPGVARADGPRRVVELPARLGDSAGRIGLVELPPPGGLDRPLILHGRAATGMGEVVLEDALAGAERIVPGMTVTFGGQSLRVVGTGITTQPRAGGWTTAAEIAALARTPGATVSTAYALRLADADTSGTFVSEAERTAGPQVILGDWKHARTDFTDDTRRMLTVLGSSTLLALLAAGFTLATSIGGRVIGERRRIGLLRAVGITPRGVTGLLVAHYLVLAAVAAPLGLLVGLLLAPGVLAMASVAIGMPQPAAPGAATIAAVLVAVLAMVAVATAIPAWRAGRVVPVEALAIGRAVATGGASRLAWLARRLRLPVVVVLGAKDAFARPARAALTVASLVLAAVLVVCAMGFEATINRLSTDSAMRAKPWEIRVSGVTLPHAKVERILLDRPELSAVARVYEPRLVTDDGRTELASRVVDPVRGDVAAFPFAIRDGRAATAPGEVTLGRGALDRLGVHVGDRIRLRAGGVPFSVLVVGRHIEPDDGGRVAVLPAASLPERPSRLDDPYWVARVRPGADAAAVEAALERAGGGRLAVERPIESMRSEAADTRPIIYGVAVLLLVIAAANLLTTLLLGVRERRRDAAVLGAVGATPGQVGATVVAGAALLTALASLAGLPLGALLYRAMISTTDPADGPDVVTLPGVVWVLLAAPVALALTAAVSSLAARQAARVPAAAVLRAE